MYTNILMIITIQVDCWRVSYGGEPKIMGFNATNGPTLFPRNAHTGLSIHQVQQLHKKKGRIRLN